MILRSRLRGLEKEIPQAGRCPACAPIQFLNVDPDGKPLETLITISKQCGRPAEVIEVAESVQCMTDAQLEAVIGVTRPTDTRLLNLVPTTLLQE